MQSTQTLKRRITSVNSTQQVTKAMNLVASVSLRRLTARLNNARPLFHETMRVIDELRSCGSVEESVFVKPRMVKSSAYIVVTSDRGLCGGYNINIAEKALAGMNDGKQEKIIAVGARGWEYFRRRGKNVLRKYTGISETARYEDAEMLGMYLTSLYTSGEVDEVYFAYTHFNTILSHEPRLVKILPIEHRLDANLCPGSMEYDPDAKTLLEYLAPMFLTTAVYGGLLESAACEQGARMVNMDAAANNATDIIDDLTLTYNRIRQNAITQEITEIVSGANALE